MDAAQIDRDAFRHLTAKADENGKQDNPSPYFIAGGERIDLGHVLLTLDALLHPSTAKPYTTLGILNIVPASWPADVALGGYWAETHERDGAPGATGGPLTLPAADVKGYYDMSAPEPDLLGDVDGFGLFTEMSRNAGRKFSAIVRGFYLGSPAGVKHRYQNFCARNLIATTTSGGVVQGSVDHFVGRIDKFNDMCDAIDHLGRTFSTAWVTAELPPPRKWKHSAKVLQLFVAWLEGKLKAELAAKAGT